MINFPIKVTLSGLEIFICEPCINNKWFPAKNVKHVSEKLPKGLFNTKQIFMSQLHKVIHTNNPAFLDAE